MGHDIIQVLFVEGANVLLGYGTGSLFISGPKGWQATATLIFRNID
jgi:hypothetical protein